LDHDLFKVKESYSPREKDCETKVIEAQLGLKALEALYFINQNDYNAKSTYAKHHSNAKFFKGYMSGGGKSQARNSVGIVGSGKSTKHFKGINRKDKTIEVAIKVINTEILDETKK